MPGGASSGLRAGVQMLQDRELHVLCRLQLQHCLFRHCLSTLYHPGVNDNLDTVNVNCRVNSVPFHPLAGDTIERPFRKPDWWGQLRAEMFVDVAARKGSTSKTTGTHITSSKIGTNTNIGRKHRNKSGNRTMGLKAKHVVMFGRKKAEQTQEHWTNWWHPATKDNKHRSVG